MKKLLIALIICIATSFATKAQTPPLNKQQTIDYIETLFKSTYRAKVEVLSIHVDGKVLVIKLSQGYIYRRDLSKIGELKVAKDDLGEHFFYITPTDKDYQILWSIQLEVDAIRLKKALEHLIELLKAEKSMDPFDN